MAKNKLIWSALTFIVIAGAAVAKAPPAPAKKTDTTKKSGVAEIAVVRWYDSYETAVKMSKLKKKPLFIDFTAKWCGWCEKMDKEVLSHQEIAVKLQKFVCVRIDVDKDRRTAYGYGVSSLPRVIIVNTHSEIVGDWLGYRGRDDFSKLLDDIMEYANTKTGAIEAPNITSAGTKAGPAVKTVTVDLSSNEKAIEQLACKDPALRLAVIAQLATIPTKAMAIATAGLGSKYLGIRIASWELMKKINPSPIDFDPWASTKQRNELLKLLKTPEKPTKKSTEKSAGKSTE
ncbi:MAG: thioredoxin family protein [Planctomycetes bacterium]|nr:thioredoxin family protein [Planctomycetota bacterium]